MKSFLCIFMSIPFLFTLMQKTKKQLREFFTWVNCILAEKEYMKEDKDTEPCGAIEITTQELTISRSNLYSFQIKVSCKNIYMVIKSIFNKMYQNYGHRNKFCTVVRFFQMTSFWYLRLNRNMLFGFFFDAQLHTCKMKGLFFSIDHGPNCIVRGEMRVFLDISKDECGKWSMWSYQNHKYYFEHVKGMNDKHYLN